MKESKQSSVSVFRLEYEIQPSMSAWTAFVAAFSHEEAVAHIMRTVSKPVNIVSSGLQCRLDDLSSEVRHNVIMRWNMSQPKTNTTVTKALPAEEEEVGKTTKESRLEETVIEDQIKKEKKKISLGK